MPKIQEYFTKEEKLTPLGQGETAWTGAGRRIAPAYNEAASLIRESEREIVAGGEDIVGAAGLNVKGAEAEVRAAGLGVDAGRAEGAANDLAAGVRSKLMKAWASEFKDLYDIGEQGAPKIRGGGGGVNLRGGRDSDPFGILKDHPLNAGGYGAASEILGNGVALTNRITGNKGGFLTGPGDAKQSGRGLISPLGNGDNLVGEWQQSIGIPTGDKQQVAPEGYDPEHPDDQTTPLFMSPNGDTVLPNYAPAWDISGGPSVPPTPADPDLLSNILSGIGNFFSTPAPSSGVGENAQASDG
jgi:hypothetical protein